MGRSPQKFFAEVQVTPSRFEVLSTLEESEGEKEQIEDIETEEKKDNSAEGEIEGNKKEDNKESSVKVDEGKTRMVEGGRKILLRDSKTRHKVLSEASNQAKNDLGTKRGSRKNL